jgi:hypothetical protein
LFQINACKTDSFIFLKCYSASISSLLQSCNLFITGLVEPIKADISRNFCDKLIFNSEFSFITALKEIQEGEINTETVI